MAENTTDRRVRKTRGQLRQGLVRLYNADKTYRG